MNNKAIYCAVAGHIVIDDVIFHTGETCFGQLGGNSLYAATGIWFWDREHVGIASRRGYNLPRDQIEIYTHKGFDLSGIRDEPKIKSPQSWQIYDEHSNRYTIFNPNGGDRNEMSPDISCFPESFWDIKGLHLAPITPIELIDGILEKYHGRCTITCDPSVYWFVPDMRGKVSRILEKIDVFLPSESELMLFYGLTRQLPLHMYLPYLKDLSELGAKRILLKAGKQGIVVCDSLNGECYGLPAPPVECVNATGAGDAFCGGFLYNYMESQDLFSAALCGTTSASFVIERNLIVDCLQVTPEMVSTRYRELVPALNKKYFS